MPSEIDKMRLACKMLLPGNDTQFDAHVRLFAYPLEPVWRESEGAEPGIQPDGSFVPAGPPKTFQAGFKFWFGVANVAINHRDVDIFQYQHQPVGLYLEDGRPLGTAIVVKVDRINSSSMLYFAGVEPLAQFDGTEHAETPGG